MYLLRFDPISFLLSVATADHGVASENAQSRADDENTVGTSSENSTWLASKEADEATQRKEYDTFLVTHFAEVGTSLLIHNLLILPLSRYSHFVSCGMW